MVSISRRTALICGGAVMSAAVVGCSTASSGGSTHAPSAAIAAGPLASTTLLDSGGERWASRLFVDSHAATWSMWTNSGGDGTLVRLDPDGTITTFPVAGVGVGTTTSSYCEAADGSVWAALGYRLVRVADGKATVMVLPKTVDSQLAGATDTSAPLGGTWVSAIAAYGSDVAVARLNVPQLVLYAANGQSRPGPALGQHYAGAQAMVTVAQSLIVAPGWSASGDTLNCVQVDGAGQVSVLSGTSGVQEFRPGSSGWFGAGPATAVDLSTGKPMSVPVANVTQSRYTSDSGVAGWVDTKNAQIIQYTSAERDAKLVARQGVAAGGTGGLVKTTESVPDLAVLPTGAIIALRAGGTQLARLS